METYRYTVIYWGSHPEDNNDDCLHTIDTNDPNKAMSIYFAPVCDYSVAYVEIDGFTDEQLEKLAVTRVRKNPHYQTEKRSFGF